ncbi:MAG: hypothetical protein ACM3ZS_01080 [Nitrososphaerota archaeon]|jgi:hypothetical protein
MLDSVILGGLILDVIASFLLYWKKIFRSQDIIEKMSIEKEYEIKHRSIETKLSRLGAILLIAGFLIQIVGYAI